MVAQDDDWFNRLQKKLASQPKASLEDAAAYAAERKADENTIWDWAQMQPNGDIAVRVTKYGENGEHGTGEFVVHRGDIDYEKCRVEYGLDAPGDTRHIRKRLIGTEWVTELNQKTTTNTSADPSKRPGTESKPKSA